MTVEGSIRVDHVDVDSLVPRPGDRGSTSVRRMAPNWSSQSARAVSAPAPRHVVAFGSPSKKSGVVEDDDLRIGRIGRHHRVHLLEMRLQIRHDLVFVYVGRFWITADGAAVFAFWSDTIELNLDEGVNSSRS
jgi:hypothetical protein